MYVLRDLYVCIIHRNLFSKDKLKGKGYIFKNLNQG